MYLFDRGKILVFLVLSILVIAWSKQTTNPLMGIIEAFEITVNSYLWVVVLIFVETLRQIHYYITENLPKYNSFSNKTIENLWKGINSLPDYTRYRLGRLLKIGFILWIFGTIIGSFAKVSALTALITLPSRILGALPFVLQLFVVLLSAMVYIVAMLFIMSRGDTQIYMPDEIKTRFSDVYGQDHVIEKVKEVMDLLEDPLEIESLGGHVPGGILLWGPPGTGKTLIAEAVAGETGKPFIFVGPGSFQSPFVGGGILTVKVLFRKARKLALRYGGVVLFFDEADSLGNRGALPGASRYDSLNYNSSNPICTNQIYIDSKTNRLNHESSKSTFSNDVNKMVVGGGANMGQLQALLTELQGLSRPRGFFNRTVRKLLGMKPRPPHKYRIVTVMATNMPDSLDPALLRPGRIDRQFRVGYPSLDGRITTYRMYLNKSSHNLTEDEIGKFARLTPAASGAKVKDMVNEALLIARKESRTLITYQDLVKARHLKELGPTDGSTYVERERHAVAIHEACHAVAAHLVRFHRNIDIATIERGSDYLGAVFSHNPEELVTQWTTDYEADIMVSIASVVGERIFFSGFNSSGVSGDIESATRIASLMEKEWGMGKSLTSHQVSGSKEDSIFSKSIEERVSILSLRVEKMLIENRVKVLSVAHALEEFKTITGTDIEAIMNGTMGILVDGTVYAAKSVSESLEDYHKVAAKALSEHMPVPLPIPYFGRNVDGPVPRQKNVPPADAYTN
jgi:ATP-dependent Zn protease